MALFKCPGLEVEFRWGTFFAQIKGLGEMWLETNAPIQGRQWADCIIEGDTVFLFFGRTNVVLCRPFTPVSVSAA